MRGPGFLIVLCLSTAAYCQSSQYPTPVITGYVTRAVSGSDFDVNAIRVICGPDTRFGSSAGAFYESGCPEVAPAFGQKIDVYGHVNKKKGTVAAERLEIKPIARDDISGFAVIDAVVGTGAGAAGTAQVRADGYRILVTAGTEVSFEAPLGSMADVMTNVWIEYDAKARPDGVLVARRAKFSQNLISDKEDAMRAKSEYDPAAVPAEAKQNVVAIAVGIPPDPKKIPPWPDQEMQERLNAVGEKLVPAYQHQLAASDPSRIEFRFQLTDGKRWPLVMTLPSGIILVPHQVVERMENDSQLAEVLADAIACALEKQTYRMRLASAAVTTGALASWAEFVPLIGGPAALAGIGSGTTQLVVIRKEEHQSGRVSLDLMYDAGYDVREAPMAWWLLNSRKPKPVEEIDMPDRAAYLYRIIAETWRAARS
jgi:hypothetical protein